MRGARTQRRPAAVERAVDGRSAGRNGNRAETARLASSSGPATAPAGTRARKAIGSASRKASSEAARTSRASAPMATPSAPKASAPSASAGSQRAKRPHSSSTNSPIPHSSARPTTNAHAALSATFSPSSAVRDTSPRTSRPKAWSSRSRASSPAASRTVTNISEMVTDTAMAKALSDVRRPDRTVRRRAIGWPTESSTAPDRPRLSIATPAKSATRRTPRASGEPGGSRRSASRSRACERCRPSTSKRCPAPRSRRPAGGCPGSARRAG